jgi:hypothetical protein
MDLRYREELSNQLSAPINALSAEALLARMLANIDDKCAERGRLRKEQGAPVKGISPRCAELVMRAGGQLKKVGTLATRMLAVCSEHHASNARRLS